MNDKHYDIAVAELEAELNEGIMSVTEFNHYMKELRDEYREANDK